LAYLAGRLAAMPEGDTTVLDNSCLMLISLAYCCLDATMSVDKTRPRRRSHDRSNADRSNARLQLRPLLAPRSEEGRQSPPADGGHRGVVQAPQRQTRHVYHAAA